MILLYFPDAPALYTRRGWRLPTSIGRVYDSSRIERVLGLTDYGRVLDALRTGGRLPFAYDCLPIAEGTAPRRRESGQGTLSPQACCRARQERSTRYPGSIGATAVGTDPRFCARTVR
jgi:hypothetical protein